MDVELYIYDLSKVRHFQIFKYSPTSTNAEQGLARMVRNTTGVC